MVKVVMAFVPEPPPPEPPAVRKKPVGLPLRDMPATFWPVTTQKIFVPAGKVGLGVQVRTALPALQASVVVSMAPPRVKNWTEVWAVSIGSLKVKTTAAEVETPPSEFGGTVETMVG